jgi:hypothetical protein
MAYDSESGRVVLFGGMRPDGRNGETWTCSPPGNSPPDVPKMTGPSLGLKDIGYTFSMSAIDDDQDDVRYIIDWGDGIRNETSYHASGKAVNISHAWTSVGMYGVKAKGIDSRGAESIWSSSHAISITVLPAPEIKGTEPANGDVNVPLSTAIRINFSRTMNTSATVGAMTIVPDVYLSSKWSEQDTLLELTPLSSLNQNTTYTVTVSTGAESKDGSHLASNYSFSFRTVPKEKVPEPPVALPYISLLLIFIVMFIGVVAIILVLAVRRKKRRVRRRVKD